MTATYPSVSQLVRCVYDNWDTGFNFAADWRKAGAVFPVKNQILTIRRVGAAMHAAGGFFLTFQEIRNPIISLFIGWPVQECAFCAASFVPLDDLDEDEKRRERAPLETGREYDPPRRIVVGKPTVKA